MNRGRTLMGSLAAVVVAAPAAYAISPGPPVLTVRSDKATVAQDTAAVKVACDEESSGNCSGTARLYRRKGFPGDTTLYGQRRYTLKKGDRLTIRIPLNRAGRKLMRDRRSAKVVLSVAFKSFSGTTANLTLKR